MAVDAHHRRIVGCGKSAWHTGLESGQVRHSGCSNPDVEAIDRSRAVQVDGIKGNGSDITGSKACRRKLRGQDEELVLGSKNVPLSKSGGTFY